MERLKILPQDNSPRSVGKLVEKITSQVLNFNGYHIEQILNINDSGKKLDVKGIDTGTGLPFYAECKCAETSVAASEVQAFYGKYMVHWHTNNSCHGILMAVSGLDPAAETFYRRHIGANPKVTVQLYDQDAILQAVTVLPDVADPKTITGRIASMAGTPGDRLLLYTDKGVFWLQHVVRPDKQHRRCVAIFDAAGNPLSDKQALEYLAKLYPKVSDYNNITAGVTIALQPGLFPDTEEIGELSGCSDYFDYRFPVSPEHFVGRQSYFGQIDDFANKVLEKKTSYRSLVIKAPPGFGKSSLVLAGAARLGEQGHFALALDVRSVSSPRFVLHTIDNVRRQLNNFDEHICATDYSKPFVELEDAINTIIKIGRILERQAKLAVVFFDRFENVLSRTDILEQFRDVHLEVSKAQTNVVLGFVLNSSVTGRTDVFDDERLESIADTSSHIILDVFSKNEINKILDRLEEKLGKPLIKDLRFHLAEFSHGCPWLLKKLCFQTIDLLQTGVPQADICGRLLNLETLFRQDNYLLLAKPATVAKAVKILQESNEFLETSKFAARAKLSARAFYCVARDMVLLNIAHRDHDNLILQAKLPENSKSFEISWRNYLQNRLQGNRLVQNVLKKLKTQRSLKIEELAQLLEDLCPYLAASRKTWMAHARIFTSWLNTADLALADGKKRSLTCYDSQTQIREHQLVLPKRRGTTMPQIQYSPVEDVAVKLWQALGEGGRVDWTGQKRNTIYRALATLEDFGFIQRKRQVIRVLPKCFEFVSKPQRRSELFAQSALKLEAFEKFIKILEIHKEKGNTLAALGLELKDTLGVSWKESTAEKTAKILLDWARHTKLAPGVFAHVRKGPLKGWKKKEDMQIPLF